jgi:hypothetical protein
MPTFNVLIATIGRETLQRMLDSLTYMLDEDDCITIVFDGHSEIPNFNVSQFRCKVNQFCEPVALGFFGHGIRNKYAEIMEPRDFVMHADDDDIYREGIFRLLRQVCIDPFKLYIGRMISNGHIIPNHGNKKVAIGDIGTPCGVIPYELNKRGKWLHRYCGDFEFYNQISNIILQENSEGVKFIDVLIYLVTPTMEVIHKQFEYIKKYENLLN